MEFRHRDRIRHGGEDSYGKAGSADHRFCGPRLFGPLMERSNSCARMGGYSHAVDDQTAAFVLFLGTHAGAFLVT
jgi:hypothetical protein